MANKPAFTIANQIALLKKRGMLFHNDAKAPHFLENISYYRLKGYWWDMQNDYTNHILKANTYFEDIIDRYNFDRHLRLILFDAIERIEIALRTKMIYHLSISYGGLWYLNTTLFESSTITLNDGTVKTIHQNTIDELQKNLIQAKKFSLKIRLPTLKLTTFLESFSRA